MSVRKRRYLRVRNWTEFQHYAKRSPPWIKVYNELLDNPAFSFLPDVSKAHLVGIWLLASRCENRILADPKWIASRISASDPVDLEGLVADGWLEECPECDASNTLASCKQDASKVLAGRKQDASNTLATVSECEKTVASLSRAEQSRDRGETETEERESVRGGQAPPPPPSLPEENSDPPKRGKPKEAPPETVQKLVGIFNEVTGRGFRGLTEKQRRFVAKEQITPEQVELVCRHKWLEWATAPPGRVYLKPSTVLRPAHWQDYLQDAQEWAEAVGEVTPQPAHAQIAEAAAQPELAPRPDTNRRDPCPMIASITRQWGTHLLPEDHERYLAPIARRLERAPHSDRALRQRLGRAERWLTRDLVAAWVQASPTLRERPKAGSLRKLVEDLEAQVEPGVMAGNLARYTGAQLVAEEVGSPEADLAVQAVTLCAEVRQQEAGAGEAWTTARDIAGQLAALLEELCEMTGEEEAA